MTDIEKKALALVTQLQEEDDGKKYSYAYYFEALCRAIEQHEAYKQEVSDAVEEIAKAWGTADPAWGYLRRFIIPKPDPLVEVMNEMGFGMSKTAAEEFRAAMLARGYEFTKIGENAGE